MHIKTNYQMPLSQFNMLMLVPEDQVKLLMAHSGWLHFLQGNVEIFDNTCTTDDMTARSVSQLRSKKLRRPSPGSMWLLILVRDSCRTI